MGSESIVESNSLKRKRSPIIELECLSEIQVVNFRYTWVITNFKQLNKVIETPEFSSDPNSKLKWQIRLYPDGNANNKGSISLYLCLKGSDEEPYTECSFSIIDTTNRPKRATTFLIKMHQGRSYGWSSYIPRENLLDGSNNFLKDGTLTIQCNIKVSTGQIESNQIIFQSPQISSQNQLANDLEELLNSGDCSDFKLVVRNKEFHVHKSVLVSRSPVFAAMLKSNMKENRDNKAIVNDFDPLVFEEVLRFIYCGRTKAIEKLDKDMIPIAEKYDLVNLKMLCEQSMSAKLKVNDAADTLGFADLYNCAYLKKKTMEFMLEHLTESKDTAGYQNLKKSKPLLLLELYEL
ncbi:hypothetical protein QAD02_019797 [Eretmocerus hayati]|uniref:Uncharacterized protein n=1 Tax=Eretmocerus hayati TaxID=131215 RepID=A0ACC2PKQ6_9HYME|nr:hypothetical protein QAD02_019797 [Eretmocerus hayati]